MTAESTIATPIAPLLLDTKDAAPAFLPPDPEGIPRELRERQEVEA